MFVGDLAALSVRGLGVENAPISTQRGGRAAYLSIPKGASRSIIAAMIVMTAPVVASNPAMAGSCTLTTTAVCSGPASTTRTDTAVTITSPQPVTVSTEAGFGYDNTALGTNTQGINITGNGVNFTDAHNSQIRAGLEALKIQNNGGNANITVTGRLDSTGNRSTGFDTFGFEYRGSTSAGTATISLNETVSRDTGLLAEHEGTGDLNLTVANVSSALDHALRASSTRGGDLNLTVTGHVGSANTIGVSTTVRGGGDATLRVNSVAGGTVALTHTHGSAGVSNLFIDNVTSTTGDGVSISSSDTAGDLNVTIGEVRVQNRGISGNYTGVGDYTLNVTGDINATEMVHLAAITSSRGRDLTVNMVNSSGAGLGVNFQNQGVGDGYFTSTGTIRSTTFTGAQLITRTTSNNFTGRLNNVFAHGIGILLETNGRGIADLEVTGQVISADTFGIRARSAGVGNTAATGMNIRSHDVRGHETGAYLTYNGTGDVNFTSTGLLQSDTEEAFYARVQATAADLTVRLHNVEAFLNGVDITHNGTGVLDVAVSGDVESNAAGLVLVTNGQNSGLTVDLQNVTGRTYGVITENNGVGATNLTTRGTVTGTANDGINFVATNTTGNMTANLATVTGGAMGAYLEHGGRGTVNITATGPVTGTRGDGLRSVSGPTTTNVAVNLASVTGGAHGVYLEHGGTGTTNITATDALTGGTGDGLRFVSGANTGNVTVNLEEASGGGHGALLSYAGSGAVDVTATGALTGRGGDGLQVATGATATGLTAQLVDATGSANGAYLSFLGMGLVDATITGQATGNAGDGLVIVNTALNQGVTAAVNGLRGQNNGANIEHQGRGALDFTATGNLVGVTQAGARLVTRTAAEGLTARVQQAQGATHGVLAILRGTGTLDFAAEGDLIGTNGHGAYLVTEATADNIVARVGNAEGGQNGVFVEHGGTGDVDLTTTGTIVGNSRIGVAVTTSAATNNAVVEVNDVTGSIVGVNIAHSGRGNLNLTANGHVRGEDGHGVNLVGAATTNDMIANVQTASGWTNGIFANHEGRGRLDVTAAGAVSGAGGDGVGLFASGTVTGVTASVAAVTGSSNGTFIVNNGTGDLTFTASGLQKGNIADGVRLTSASTAGAIAATIGAADGARHGVYVDHKGSGSVNVTASGDVTGGAGDGVHVLTEASSQGVTMDVQGATGSYNGIYNQHLGRGIVDISAAGDVVGREAIGLHVDAGAPSEGVSAQLNNVSGATIGVMIHHAGTGNLTLRADGQISGTAEEGVLLVADRETSGLDARVQGVKGGSIGVKASHSGTGSLNFVGEGPIVGESREGVYVTAGDRAEGMNVTVAQVTGATDGVNLALESQGVLNFTALGDVVGTSGDGVDLSTSASTAGLTANVHNVTGGLTGVTARHQGAGELVLTTTGRVSGLGGDGVSLVSAAGSSGVKAQLGDVSGSVNGVSASHDGTGSLILNAGDAVNGAGGDGIRLTTGASSSGLNATVGVVNGAQNGVVAAHNGAGALDLTATGTVTGSAADGLVLTTAEASTGLNATVGAVTGARNGVVATHNGTGALTFTAAGAAPALAPMSAGLLSAGGAGALSLAAANTGASGVSGAAADGVRLTTGANATALTANVASVTGGVNGVVATHNGTGALSLTATGAGSGGSGDGVILTTAASTNGLDARVASVSGGVNGVSAVHGGSGVLNFVSSGNVTGGTGHGVSLTSNGAAQGITASVQNVSGALAGVYVETANAVPADLTLNGLTQGGVAGVSAKLASGPLSIQNIGTLQNADGLSASTALVVDSAAAKVQLVNSGTLHGAVRLGGGDDVVDNRGLWNGAGGTHDFGGGSDLFTNAASGTFRAASVATAAEVTRLNGLERTVNNGLITMVDGGADDQLIVSGDLQFGAGSVLAVDINRAGDADLLTVGGKASLNGVTLKVNDVGARPVVGSRYTIVNAGSLDGQFTLNDSHITSFLGLSAFYTDTLAGLELVQRRKLEEAADTGNQGEVARELDRLPDGNDMKDNLLDLDNDDQARNAFDQLTGEAHAGVRTTMAEDSRLPRNAVLDRLSQGGGSAIWGKGLWNRSTSDGDRGTAKTKREAWGVLAGADVALGDNLVLGVSGAYLDNDISQHSRSADGKVESIHVLGYLGLEAGAFRLKAGAGYAWADVETSRSVSFANFKDRLTADYKANLFQAFGEVGVRLPLGGGYVEPIAQITHLRVKTDGFSEAGREAALTVQSAVDKTTMSTLGARFETSTNGPISVGGLVGWQRAYGNLAPVSRMNFAGGQGFNIQGVPLSRNAGVVQVEARFRLSDKATLGLGYDGVIGTASQEHAALASFRLAF